MAKRLARDACSVLRTSKLACCKYPVALWGIFFVEILVVDPKIAPMPELSIGARNAPCCSNRTERGPEPGRAVRCAARGGQDETFCRRGIGRRGCPVGCGCCAVCPGAPWYRHYASIYAEVTRRPTAGFCPALKNTAGAVPIVDATSSNGTDGLWCQKDLRLRQERRPRPATWRLCVPRTGFKRGKWWPGPQGRWLIAYPHETNGLANRFAGIRASLEIARISHRRLRIRWFGSAFQEGAFLQPARRQDPELRWDALDAPGVGSRADGKVHDAWGQVPKGMDARWFKDVRTHHFNYHPFARLRAVVDGKYDLEESRRDVLQDRVCARALISPFPTNCYHHRDVRAFLAHANASKESTVITRKLFYDVVYPHRTQAELTAHAHRQYRSLFAPTAEFIAAACAHLHRLGLSLDIPWIGLQLRRTATNPELARQQLMLSATLAASRNGSSMSGSDGDSVGGSIGGGSGSSAGGSGSSSAGRSVPGMGASAIDESELKDAESAGINAGVTCALRVRASLCLRDHSLCRAPIFVTSSSPAFLQRAGQALGDDARYAHDDSFTYHGAFSGTHLSPLLEFTTLSASRVVIGTAGSSFPVEAAYVGNTTAILKAMNGIYSNVKEPARFIQGECELTELPPPAESVLLPRDSCSRQIHS